MPIPADETMFYPLPSEVCDSPRFAAEVGFVEHADRYGDNAFENFVRTHLDSIQTPAVRDGRRRFSRMCTVRRADEKRCYEDEILEFVRKRLSDAFRSQYDAEVQQFVSTFYISVHASTWRYQFINALAEAGLDLALYGKGWISTLVSVPLPAEAWIARRN